MSRFMVRRRDFLCIAGATLGTATLSTATLGSTLTTSAHAVEGPDAVSFNTIGFPKGLKTLTSAWGQLQEAAPDRIQLTSEPKYKANANAMCITVKPGDVGPLYRGGSSEGAEVSGMRDVNGRYIFETEESGTQYLAFSIYVPKTWQPPHWAIAAQLHGPDLFGAALPTLSISLIDKYRLRITAGNLDVLGVDHGALMDFTDGGQIAFDTWQDFIVKVTFSRRDEGAVTVWRRTIGDGKFQTAIDVQNVETLQSMPSVEATPAFRNGHGSSIHEYWTQGFYRSPDPNLTSVLYYSGLVRANSFAAAEFAAFATHDGPEEISFNTIGFPQGLTTLTSAWGILFEAAPDRIVLTSEPKYKANANAMRITVKPGDVIKVKSGGVLRATPGERAEVTGMKNGNHYMFETEASRTQYFAFSIYIPKTWQPPEVDPACNCIWGIPLQLHGPDLFGASPTMALSLLDKYTFSINAGNLDVLGKYHGVPIAFADGGQIAFDTWEDFIVKATFSRRDEGAVTIWRRVIGDKKFKKVIDVQNIATLQSMPSVEGTSAWQQGYGGMIQEYWHQGFYRSTSPNVVNVLYQSGLVRADSFAAAEFAAFATHDGN